MGLLTSTVGSFPKPAELIRARRAHAEGDLEDAALQVQEQQALRETLALQAELGLDLLVGGDMDRDDLVSYFAERIDGMEIAGLVRVYGNRYVRKPRIVGEVSRTGPMSVAGWKLAHGAAASKPVKAILTGPYTLMDRSFDEHYSSREACTLALAEVIRLEAEDLAAAGATDLQIDEPAIGGRPDEVALATRALAQVTSGLRGRVRTWAHVCSERDEGALESLFALPVDGLMLELSGSGPEHLERLRRLPSDKLLGAGVVDVRAGEIEGSAQIRTRIERLLELVPPARVWINPDCGLAELTADAARAKLSAMMDAVRAVRQAHRL